MIEFKVRAQGYRITPDERARRLSQAYLLVLSWKIPIKGPDPKGHSNDPEDEKAKPAGDAADLAVEKANPRSENGEFTSEQYNIPINP